MTGAGAGTGVCTVGGTVTCGTVAGGTVAVGSVTGGCGTGGIGKGEGVTAFGGSDSTGGVITTGAAGPEGEVAGSWIAGFGAGPETSGVFKAGGGRLFPEVVGTLGSATGAGISRGGTGSGPRSMVSGVPGFVAAGLGGTGLGGTGLGGTGPVGSADLNTAPPVKDGIVIPAGTSVGAGRVVDAVGATPPVSGFGESCTSRTELTRESRLGMVAGSAGAVDAGTDSGSVGRVTTGTSCARSVTGKSIPNIDRQSAVLNLTEARAKDAITYGFKLPDG